MSGELNRTHKQRRLKRYCLLGYNLMKSGKNVYRFGDLVPHLQQAIFYFSSTVVNLKDIFSNGRSDNCTQKRRLCVRSTWLQIQFYSAISWRQLCTKIAVYWNTTPCNLVDVPTFQTNLLPPSTRQILWRQQNSLIFRFTSTRLLGVLSYITIITVTPVFTSNLTLTHKFTALSLHSFSD